MEAKRAALRASDTSSAQGIYLASESIGRCQSEHSPLADVSINTNLSESGSNLPSKRTPSSLSTSISPSSIASGVTCPHVHAADGVPAMDGLSLPHDEPVAIAATDSALAPTTSLPAGLVDVHASVPEATFEQPEPSELQAVLISDATVVRHLHSRPFTLYRLFVPSTTHGEHVAFRRYSDFLALDTQLRLSLGGGHVDFLPCIGARVSHPPPPRQNARNVH